MGNEDLCRNKIESTIGYVDFDYNISDENNKIGFKVAYDDIKLIVRGNYVKIVDSRGLNFLGRVVEGPYYLTDDVSPNSAFAQVAILRAKSFPSTPDYHAECKIELLGIINENRVINCYTRPHPKSPVLTLQPKEIEQIIGVDGGDILLGSLDGYTNTQIFLDSSNKKVIPRNIGIFGTVGSGKTNTAQVLQEELCNAGWAVIIIDIEGEYTEMDKPTEQVELLKKLRSYNMNPEGFRDFKIFCIANSECSRGDVEEFTVRFADIDPYVLTELIDAEDAQERRLMDLVEAIKRDKQNKHVENTTSKMLLNSLAGHEIGEGPLDSYTLNEIIDVIDKWLTDRRDDSGHPINSPSSYYALRGKLNKLRRLNVFDIPGVKNLTANELLVPGRVSVIDISGTDGNDRLNNIITAEVLRTVFNAKTSNNSQNLPKTAIFIEEAHVFVSKEKKDKMEATLDMLKEISRRGRKRWLSLVFISQQPAHIPPEIFELCNTKFVHQTTGNQNINALKVSAGSIDESLWRDVPVMSPGNALIISPQFKHPINVNMRPCKTKRRFTE